MSFKLLTFEHQGCPCGGVMVGDRIFRLADVLGQREDMSVLEALEQWDETHERLKSFSTRSSEARPQSWAAESVKLLAPILYPGEIYCAGANYNDHIGEMFNVMGIEHKGTMKEVGELPWHFIKSSRSAVVGPGATVSLPTYANKVDWEIELVAVIGRPARNVAVEDALGYVAGYTIANDLSARDATRRPGNSVDSPFHWDRISSKCFEGACPLGPWIVPADDFDPSDVGMRLWINDELMQDSRSRFMIFDTAEQIAMLSSRMTLHPGDIILTGSPSGVGMGRGIFLKAGDKVRMAVEGIGEMSHSLA